jgi:tetratricopeptide (TPR) repeat protein
VTTPAASSRAIARLGAVAMMEDQMLPRQITELAGAMATRELLEGNRKKARRFFKASMLDPNANALAQAEWATPNFGDALFSASTLNAVEEAHEARAYYLSRDGQFAEVYAECEAWGFSEPYSIRPYELWAATANVLDHHEQAEEVTRRGLKLRTNAPLLLNSRTYALVGLNRLDEAEATLNRLPSDTPEWISRIADANRGLIAFHRGRPLEGVASYQAAIDGFQKLGIAPMALSAKTYLCREMIRYGLPEGEKMLEVLRPSVKSSNSASLKKVFKDAETFLAARKMLSDNDLLPQARTR